MRRLAALTFIVVSIAALTARVAGPVDIAPPLQLSLILPPLETAPLLPMTGKAGTGPLSLTAHPPAETPGEEKQVSILLAGDTGLNSSFQPVQAGFGLRYGARIAFSEATPDIAGMITGDVNFANLETVVTDRNSLGATPKMFGFRTHPDGVRELIRVGFNLFSTANNHALDYGRAGAGETLRHLDAVGVVHAGLGRTPEEAAAARVIERRGVRIALGAIGIGGAGFDPDEGASQLAFTEKNLSQVVSNLASSDARVRILSAHYGDEFDVKTTAAERTRFHAALEGGADIVVGHHQHVVAGIELVGDKVIFYGLGNFLHWGTQDMGRHDMCRDYGLVARVHLAGAEGQPMAVLAIEAIAVTDMHARPRPLDASTASERIHVLNYLNEQFGARGVRFGIGDDGTGLYCAPGAERLRGRIGVRCAAPPAMVAPSPALATRISAACARRVVRVAETEVPGNKMMPGTGGGAEAVSLQEGGAP